MSAVPSAPSAAFLPIDRDGTLLLLVPVTPAETNLPCLTPEERLQMATFTSPRRCDEWSTWRSALRRYHNPQATIAYDACGAPQLIGEALHLSVSHAGGLAAILLAPRRCAIDIERTGRNFGRVAKRFLAPDEAMLPEHDHPLFLPLMWCAKEALYKLAGLPGASLRDDLRITATDLTNGRMSGTIPSPGAPAAVCLHTFAWGDTVGVWTTE